MKIQKFSVRSALRRGFTMMEMMLVLAIIAILIGIGVYTMEGVTGDAEYLKAKSDIRAIEASLLRYKTYNRNMPTESQGLQSLVTPMAAGKILMKPEGIVDPWGTNYVYHNPGKRNPTGYDVYSVGPDKQDGTADDVWP